MRPNALEAEFWLIKIGIGSTVTKLKKDVT